MTVTATCLACGDAHLLGDRPFDGSVVTACPRCGSLRYRTEHRDFDPAAEQARIREELAAVSGVGEETLAALCERFLTYGDLARAAPAELRDVPGVGRTTARHILERVDPTLE